AGVTTNPSENDAAATSRSFFIGGIRGGDLNLQSGARQGFRRLLAFAAVLVPVALVVRAPALASLVAGFVGELMRQVRHPRPLVSGRDVAEFHPWPVRQDDDAILLVAADARPGLVLVGVAITAVQ